MINAKTAADLLTRVMDGQHFVMPIDNDSSVIEAYMYPVSGLRTVTQMNGLSVSNLTGVVNSLLSKVEGVADSDEYFLYGDVSPSGEFEVFVAHRIAADHADSELESFFCDVDRSIAHIV